MYFEGRNVSVSAILDGPSTFPTKMAAKQARAKARELLGERTGTTTTLAAFWEQWTTDPLFSRPKESTNIHNRERSRPFVEQYGTVQIRLIGDDIVGEWLAGGKRNGTVPALRAMFNDAASAKAGRLITVNPFANLGLRKTRGNRDSTPPPEAQVWDLINAAKRLTNPGFAAWLQVAAFTGMRPGELDALRWTAVDFAENRIEVLEQFNAADRTFTSPKNGEARTAILTPHARQALIELPRESEFCFTHLRGGHWTAPARAYHWKAVRAAADYEGSLYLATRHFFGSYATNVLGLDSEDVAIALGHKDGGQLVRMLYGHRNAKLALERVAAAYEQRSNVRPLHVRSRSA